MDTQQIENVLSRFTKKIDYKIWPRDVFSRNFNKMTGKINSTPRIFIVNMDRSDMPGSHWVAVYQKNTKIFVFDSAGLPPLYADMLFALRNASKGKKWFWSDRRFQKKTTATCGQFCVVFAIFIDNGRSPEQFIKHCWTDRSVYNFARNVLNVKAPFLIDDVYPPF